MGGLEWWRVEGVISVRKEKKIERGRGGRSQCDRHLCDGDEESGAAYPQTPKVPEVYGYVSSSRRLTIATCGPFPAPRQTVHPTSILVSARPHATPHQPILDVGQPYFPHSIFISPSFSLRITLSFAHWVLLDLLCLLPSSITGLSQK